jgi:hypothetical protein
MKMDTNKEKNALLDLGESLSVALIILSIGTPFWTLREFLTDSFTADLLRTIIGLGVITALGIFGLASLIMIRRHRTAESLFNRVGLGGKNPYLLALLIFVYCVFADGVSILTNWALAPSGPSNHNLHLSMLAGVTETVLGLVGVQLVNKRLGFDRDWYRSFSKKLSSRFK